MATLPYPRIVFYGTPEFAVTTLEALHKAGYPIVGVVTAPDKPAGRGQKLHESEVKKAAVRLGLPIAQPEKLKSPEFQQQLRDWDPQLQVIVAFRMLPESVWNYPQMGSLNLHASLLPAYRGAAPIQWAIVNGEKETGCTTFLLQHEIDTGDLLLQETVPIFPEDTAADLYDRLMHRGADLVVKTVAGLVEGSLEPKPQASAVGQPTAPKISKEDGRIDWTKSAQQIDHHIRGFTPFPGAWTEHEGITYKIHRAALTDVPTEGEPGQWRIEGERLLVGGRDRFLEIFDLQPAGRTRMKASEFLRGYRPSDTE